MDFAKIIGGYIRHLRKQSAHNQRIHAFSISGLVTIILTMFWLHFHYGFWSSGNQDVYSQNQTYEVRELSGSGGSSTENDALANPITVLKDFFKNAKERIDNVPLDFSSVISGTKTFERKE